MTYSSLHRVDERSQLAFLGLLVFLIVVAWAFMFLHAWVTIGLLWAGLIAFGINAVAHRRIAKAARPAESPGRCRLPLDLRRRVRRTLRLPASVQ